VTAPATESWSARRAIAWQAVATLGHVRRDARTGRWYIDLRPTARVYTFATPWGTEEPFPSDRAAERALDEIRERCSEGLSVAQAIERIRPRDASLVTAKAEEWIEAKWREVKAGKRVARSIREFRRSVDVEWPYWAGVSIFDVRAKHVEEWATRLAERGLSPNTVRTELARFHAFYAWLLAREDVSRIPPFPSIAVPKIARPTLTWEQQDAVLDQIEDQWRGVFLAMALLALRPQEARALRVCDLAGDVVHVRRAAKDEGPDAPIGGTKTGTERTLPMPPRLAEWAARWISSDPLQGSALAFGAPTGGMWGQNNLREWWARASKLAGVPVIPVRDATRHSTAQEWRRRSGADISAIRDALGHTQEATTRRHYLGAATGQLVDMMKARNR